MSLQVLLTLAAHNWPLLILQLAGTVLAYRVAPRPAAHVLALGSLWLGGSLWHIWLYTLASLQVGAYAGPISAALLGLTVLGAGFTSARRPAPRTLLWNVLGLSAVWLISLLTAAQWGSGFTYDSLQLVIQGLNWIEFGQLGNAVAQSKLLSWGGWISTLHAASYFSGAQYLSAAHPMLALQLLLMLAAALWQMHMPERPAVWLGLMGLMLALIGGSAYLSYAAVYVHNNLATAGFFLLAAYLSVLRVQDSGNVRLELVLAAWGMFGLQRMETIPLACVGVWLLFAYAQLPANAWQRVALWLTLPLSLWIMQRLSAPTPQKSVLGHASLAVYLLGVWMHPWVIRWSTASVPRKQRIADTVLLLSFGALLILLALRLPHMNISLQSMVTNLAPASAWGPFWLVLGLLLLATLDRSSSSASRFLSTVIGVFLLYVLVLAALRIAPYRVGFGDSGSRMLLHAAPLLLLLTGLRLAQAPAPSYGARAMLCATLALATVVGLDILALRQEQTRNVLAQATVRADHVAPHQIQALVLDQGSAAFDITDPTITFSWQTPRRINSLYLEMAHPGSVSDVVWYADGVSMALGDKAHLTQLKLRNMRFDRGWYSFELDQPVHELRAQFTRQSIPVTILNLGIYDAQRAWQTIARDYASQATAFSRSSLRGNGIDLQPILSDQRPDVRSRKPGPVEAVLVLPTAIGGGHIELEFYRPDEIPDHYSLAISHDGRSWHNVYACRPGACPPPEARTPTTRQYLFDSRETYRYVRIAMTHAPGTGRLWLRKIRLVGYE